MASHVDSTISVTAASQRGVSGLLKDAENGHHVIVERHGRPIAAIMSVNHMKDLAELEADLRSAALVLARAATDDGSRTDLDDVIASMGFNRAELESELDAELTSEL